MKVRKILDTTKEQEWLGAVLTPKAIEQIDKAREIEIKHNEKTLIPC